MAEKRSVAESAGSIEPARVPKMAELVASDVRRRILTGELEVGASLREAELMESYEISRPTLREGLRILEIEQLITVRRGSHRGAVVRLPDSSVAVRNITMLLFLKGATLGDIYTARSIFEPPAARLAAEHATDAEIDSLRATLDEEVAAVAAGGAAFPLVAWRFHTQLVTLSGNATLAVMAGALEHISERHAQQVVAASADRQEAAREGEKAHRRLVDLIAARDGAGAEEFWRKHMRAAGRKLLADIGDHTLIEVLD